MTTPSIEAVLRRDRAVVLAAIVAVAALAWAYITWLAASMGANDTSMPDMKMPGMDMSSMDMPGMAAPTLGFWSVAEFGFMFAMWAIMMVGMMLPSVAPMLLLYARVARQAGVQGKPFAATAWFASGYLLAWIGFSLAATLAQWLLESVLLLTPMSGLGATLGGIVLITVGLYQWTPLKDTCLTACQSPLQFVMHRGGFRRNPAGSLKLGAEHGLYCIGCCWALMALLFALGIMNVLWIAAIAAFILVEKIMPSERLLSRLVGVALVVTGAGMLMWGSA
jgi:predicted metal-binding membrane protein